MDITPLLTILAKVSGGRIISTTVRDISEGDLRSTSIPVREVLESDKTEQTLRRYAKDWIKRHGSYNVESRFEPLKNQSFYDDAGAETKLCGLLVLTWWPQPELSEYEKWQREAKMRLESRKKERD